MNAPLAVLTLGLALSPLTSAAKVPQPLARDIALAAFAAPSPDSLEGYEVVPETPNEAVPALPEAPSTEEPAQEGDQPPSDDKSPDYQELAPFPPLVTTGGGSAPSFEDGPLDAGHL